MGEPLNPCENCGQAPRRGYIGAMKAIRCKRRPRGCGQYAYGLTWVQATNNWNDRNPPRLNTGETGGGR